MINSAEDDLQRNTLSAVTGTLAKLEYVATLRQVGGEYYHWGFARRHGEVNADTALSNAHCSLFSQILRSPIRNLWDDLLILAAQRGFSPGEYLNQMKTKSPSLLPRNLNGGTARHFMSVLETLSALAREQAVQVGPSALQSLPPDR